MVVGWMGGCPIAPPSPWGWVICGSVGLPNICGGSLKSPPSPRWPRKALAACDVLCVMCSVRCGLLCAILCLRKWSCPGSVSPPHSVAAAGMLKAIRTTSLGKAAKHDAHIAALSEEVRALEGKLKEHPPVDTEVCRSGARVPSCGGGEQCLCPRGIARGRSPPTPPQPPTPLDVSAGTDMPSSTHETA